jgi:hypothetical protein
MLREGGPIARAELRARSVAPADGRQFASRLRALVSKGKLFITSEGLITANPIVIEAYATVMNAEWPA